MSLSDGEQQALDSIGNHLAGSAPGLASSLATFTWLTAGEAMPVHERIRAAGQAPSAGSIAADAQPRAQKVMTRPIRRGPGRPWVRHWLWVALAIAVIMVVLSINRSAGKNACGVLQTAGCAVQMPGPAPAPSRPGVGAATGR